MTTYYTTTMDSLPCGPLLCVVDETGAVVRIDFLNGRRPREPRQIVEEMRDAGIEVVEDPVPHDGAAPAARGVLRRRAAGFRSSPGARRDPLRALGLGRAPEDPVRRDPQLRRDRAGDRPPRRRPGGGTGQRRQPDPDRRPLPPGDRLGRLAHRFRRRPGSQVPAAGDRGAAPAVLTPIWRGAAPRRSLTPPAPLSRPPPPDGREGERLETKEIPFSVSLFSRQVGGRREKRAGVMRANLPVRQR